MRRERCFASHGAPLYQRFGKAVLPCFGEIERTLSCEFEVLESSAALLSATLVVNRKTDVLKSFTLRAAQVRGYSSAV